jgi:hypothetical protein
MAGRHDLGLAAFAHVPVLPDPDKHDLGATGIAAFAEQRHTGDEPQLLGAAHDPVVREARPLRPAHVAAVFLRRHLLTTVMPRRGFRPNLAASENGRVSLWEERAARNEALFREVNEQVRRVAQPAYSAGFVCECSQDTCAERVQVPLSVYEAVRSDPRRFILLPGHENQFERVVERADGFLIVEKEGVAGRIAEANDPRA